ncbi:MULTISPECIES: glycosyltransferase [Micromonospora]|uniref:Glycosyltransferase n=1 Tax=Micromonospora fiedleri TaxID=1157498 RepID=A0ABS1UPW0_9ACTN|nr:MULTISPECIES: glycosyltransferase [Micromonospora]AEB46887.1 glycosyl transferase [Micromonospora maris AB-18-032]MBL6277371.1 glycosyltransferase [Micromonospora fiedleri]WSK42228.1 glycosyltransferase [Micromonospora maris]
MPKCSVVISTYNRRELLRRTLDSLTRQTLPRTDFEVLVCDDGSSDGTGDMVVGYADRIDVHHLYQEDLGARVSAARNMGITAARGEVCVFLDDGVVAAPDCLRAHVEAHEAADGPLALIGYVWAYTPHHDVSAEDAARMEQILDRSDADELIAWLRADGRLPDFREEYYAKYGDDFGTEPAPWSIFWTCNVSAPTEMIREVGMFDQGFRGWGGEDCDLGYRLHRAGAYVALSRAAAAVHMPHPGASKSEEAYNYAYMADKYDTPITRLLHRYTSLEVNPFNINDVIKAEGLPSCAEYEAQAAAR